VTISRLQSGENSSFLSVYVLPCPEAESRDLSTSVQFEAFQICTTSRSETDFVVQLTSRRGVKEQGRLQLTRQPRGLIQETDGLWVTHGLVGGWTDGRRKEEMVYEVIV
jgi:hypothetical protein